MNFTQMHERLRMELLRRIQRGTLSVSLLARQTGFGQSHLSNFLRSKRQLSLDGMDRILAAQNMAAADLLPGDYRSTRLADNEESGSIPVVSHATALFEPFIRPSAVQKMLHVSARMLQTTRARATINRRTWQRYVAICVPLADSLPMEPLVLPNAMVLLDRHYNSLLPYRLDRPNLYAVRHDGHLRLRYVDFSLQRMVLRPHNVAYPVDLIEPGPNESPGDLIAGRVTLIMNEL